MDTSRGRPVTDDTEGRTEPNETMSGVGVGGDDGALEGLGFDGREDGPPRRGRGRRPPPG